VIKLILVQSADKASVANAAGDLNWTALPHCSPFISACCEIELRKSLRHWGEPIRERWSMFLVLLLRMNHRAI